MKLIYTLKDSGVARPQATGALAWGVVMKPFVYCSIFALFGTIYYCSQCSWPGTWLLAGYATAKRCLDTLTLQN
jgi:hypothetical protein